MGKHIAAKPGASPDPLDVARAEAGVTTETAGATEADELVPTIWVEFKDQRWPFRADEVNPATARALREATGWRLSELFALAADAAADDIDTDAAMVWLARRQNGEADLMLFEVEREVTVLCRPTFLATVDDVEDGDSPEA